MALFRLWKRCSSSSRYDPTGDCFFLNPFFHFWDSYSGQHFVPEIDPVRVRYLYQTRTDGGGGLVPPHPSKTDPPLPPFFLVLVQAATVFSIAPEGGPSGGQTKPPCQVDTGRGVLRGRDLCTLRPAFRCQAPADAHLSAFEWPKVRSGDRSFDSGGILRAAFPLD